MANGPIMWKNVELGGGADCCTFDEQLFAPHVVTAVKCCPSLTVLVHSSSSIQFKGTNYFYVAYVVMDCAPSVVIFGKSCCVCSTLVAMAISGANISCAEKSQSWCLFCRSVMMSILQ